MYAAAGGASLASRQARQRQRQQKKTQQLQAKLHPPKAAGIGVGVSSEHGASTPTRQSRQFHQLPTNYLRAPQAQSRKLSASYTAQSKLLLPIDEDDTQSVLHMRMHSHAPMHHSHGGHAQVHHQQHQHHNQYALHHSHQHHAPMSHYQQFATHGRVSPKLVHRHSGSSSASFQQPILTKSATATLPLVSQLETTPPTTPSGAVGVKTTALATPTSSIAAAATTSAAAAAAAAAAALEQQEVEAGAAAASITVPLYDAIIVTPATPMASPGHVAKLRPSEDLPEGAAEMQPLTGTDSYDDDEPMQPPTGPLDRKCSVYRMRRSDAFEHGESIIGIKRQLRELQFNQQQQYEPLVTDEPQLVFKGLPNGRKYQLCAYCEEGICVCEHIECAQGRAAWLERGRRCSVQEIQPQATASRRWVKRNRIQDASLTGSSDDEDFLGVLRGPSTFANAFLYVGLGTVALGLVIAFVGTGEKGFKTVELRLIGPSLIGLGLICCILRILFCICPSHCISSNKKTRKKNANKIDADHTTSLLRGESKRVSIARGHVQQPKYPITHKRSQSKMLNEGMEALRQIATTSLFMQNEQKPSMNRVVPIIKEPENVTEAPLEMKKLQTGLNMCELTDEDAELAATVVGQHIANNIDDAQIKITAATKTTTTTISTTNSTTNNSTIIKFEEPATTYNSKLARQRVAFHQQKQQQQKTTERSQSLSSSSTIKDSIEHTDAELHMETSLMLLQPTQHTINETLPAQLSTQSSTLTAKMTTSAGAIPRLKSAAFTTPAPATTQTTLRSITDRSVSTYSFTGTLPKSTTMPAAGLHTGAISLVPFSMSQPMGCDLPPAQPHTYSAAATVRGPLGMPLSALTASSSTYAMPAATSSTAVTASVSTSCTGVSLAPLLPPPPSITAPPPITAISLLPLPAPTTLTSNITTRASMEFSSSIPGQIMDMTMPANPTNLLKRGHTQPQFTTTSLSILSTAPTLLQQSRPSSLPPAAATSIAANQMSQTFSSTSNANNAYMFSAPTMYPTRTQSSTTGSSLGRGVSLLSPPNNNTNNASAANAIKFEPELVLSPAKLGQ